MRFYNLKIEHLWILLTLGTCFGYVCTQPLDQIDFWHYMKAGQVMSLSKSILDRDIFTFTIQNKPYINMHWASQIFYYFVYRIGGISLIEFLHATLVGVSFTLLYMLLKQRSRSLYIACIVTFFTFILSSTNFTLRPQGFSILFFTITLYLLKNKKLWFIPLLMVLWTNFHAAFVLGLILIAIEWIGESSSLKLIFKSSYFYTLLLASLATLINPWGFKIYKGVFSVESISRSVGKVTEWQTPSFHEWTGFCFYLALILLISLLNIKKLHLNKTDLCTFIFFTIFAFTSIRCIIWWAIATSPLFADALKEIVKVKNTKDNKSKNLWFLNWAIALVFCGYLITCLPWFKTQNLLLPVDKRQLINPDTPILISREISKNPNIKRIFNNYSWGSYFIWTNRDDQKVFYYPRVEIFSKEIINDYFLVSNGFYLWEDILRRYNVDTIATSKEEQGELIPLVKASSHWKNVYEDKLGIIFIRKN